MSLENQRQSEHAKYVRSYQLANYRMGAARKSHATKTLESLPTRGVYLDVGAGRGEMLLIAEGIGFSPVLGVEVVDYLADGERVLQGQAHSLPVEGKSVDVASMFDVIEHLVPGDDALACRELQRVARKHILVTANNTSSKNGFGDELHINRRPYQEWDALFREWFSGQVTWLPKGTNISETWRIDL